MAQIQAHGAAGQPSPAGVESAEQNTELRRALVADRADTRQHRAIFQRAIDFAIIATDRDGLVTDWNRGAEHLFGWTAAEMQGQPADRFYTPEDQASGRATLEMQRALTDGRARDERWHRRHDGSQFWASGEMLPLADDDGTHLGFLKILHDTTAQRLASEAQRADAEFLRGLLDATPDCVEVLGPDAQVEFVNAAGLRARGISTVAAVRGSDWLQRWCGVGTADAVDALAAARQNGCGQFVGRVDDGVDGGAVWWDVRITRLTDVAGRPQRLLCVLRDVTERMARAARQALLLRLADRLLPMTDPNAASAAVVDELGRHLQAAQVGFGRLPAGSATLALQATYSAIGAVLSDPLTFTAADGAADPAGRGGAMTLLHDGGASAGRAAGVAIVEPRGADGGPIKPRAPPAGTQPIGANEPTAARRPDAVTCARLGVDAYVCVSLLRDGRVAALFWVAQGGPRSWQREEVTLIEDVATRLWDALERSRVEAALRAGEGRLAGALAIAALGTFEWHLADDDVALSARAARIFGLEPSASAVTAHPAEALLARIDDADRGRVDHALRCAPREATRLDEQFRIKLPDGAGVRHVRIAGVLVAEGERDKVGLLGVVEDVTARVLVERAMRESARQFRTLAQALPNHVWTATPDGQLDWFNERVYGYSGAAEGQLEGSRWAEIVHPDDLPAALRSWQHALATGTTYEAEFRLRRADRAWRWHLTRATPLRDADGAVTRWIGTNTDIDDQRAARAVLADLNAALETRIEARTRERDRAWNNSRDLQVVIDFEGTFRAANLAWKSELGWEVEEVVGRNMFDFIHPDDRAASRRALTTATVEKLPALDNRYPHKSGGWRWISWVAAPDDGLIYAAGRHVTAERQAAAALATAQEQLRQSQKMEAVGQLTGGVAHDFNNLLQIISGNLQLIARHAAGDAKVAKRVDGAQDAVRRGARLAGQLLAFSRRQPLAPKSVDVGRLVRGMEDLLRRAIGETIAIEVSVEAGLWTTLVDPAQLENALLNLAINARDAIDGDGRLTIEVGNAWLDDAYAACHADVTPGAYVLLAVSDTGCGMTVEVIAQVFEPFFTTKPVGTGTGLGLSMVYGFVRQSGGHVKLYSEVDDGTTVKLYLPRVNRPEDLPVSVDDRPVRGGSETILVAEDDAAVRGTVIELLGSLGYRVVAAPDAAAALALVEAGTAFELLFTDVVMPGPLTSPELARRVRALRPGVAVLFTSGYTHNAMVHAGGLEDGVELLAKPYRREDLARKIRQVLADAATASRDARPAGDVTPQRGGVPGGG